MVKKREEHTTYEVGPISESRMREIMEGLWQEGGAGREALAENLRLWYKPELIKKSKAVADAVKVEFLHAWNGYKTYAWGHDYLMPISRAGGDYYGVPFGSTIIANLDTLYLMEFDDEFENALSWVEININWNQNVVIPVYECTIRWLGSLISAYLMSGHRRLLELATDLANRMLPAFSSPTGIPYTRVNLTTGATSGNINTPAHVGPLILEWGELSKLTGNPTYYNVMKAALQAIYTRRSVLDLFGHDINVDTGAWTSSSSTIDNYMEYNEGTIKGWLMFGDVDLFNWGTTLVRASIRYMAEIYNGMLWFSNVHMTTGALLGRTLLTWGQDYPLILALCGRMHEAEEFSKSCWSAWSRYNLTPTAIDYSDMHVTSAPYNLYPEYPEALFHLYYLTGDETYRQAAYQIFQKLIKYCKYDVGYTNLSDVVTGARADVMPGYFLNETLKYFYLLFADSPRFIYNPIMTTGAHVLRGVVPT